MKAIGHTTACPLTADNALIELNIDKPEPGPRDLLVRVRAVSVNPVDVKVRELMDPDGPHRILGYDAAGVVEAVGTDVSLFQPGDEVFYAGEFAWRARASGGRQHHRQDCSGRLQLEESSEAMGNPSFVHGISPITSQTGHAAAQAA